MGRMSEIAVEISERLDNGEEPKSVADSLNIPVEWVFNFENDSREYEEWSQRLDDEFFAEQSADADAENYGTR
jgi:hypothetical protein